MTRDTYSDRERFWHGVAFTAAVLLLSVAWLGGGFWAHSAGYVALSIVIMLAPVVLGLLALGGLLFMSEPYERP